eukprot:gene2470-3833_t
MYEMLVGVTPFQGGDSMQEMFVRVMEESIKYPATRVSPRAKEFISSTLERDPINRLCSLASAKLLKFFKPISWNELRHRRVTAPFIPECDDGEVGIDDRPNTDIAYQNGNISYAATSAADVEKEFAGFSFLGQEVPFIAHRKAEPRNAFSAPQFPLDSGLCSSEVGMDNRPNTDIAYQNGNISYAATSAADVEKEFAGFSFLGQEVPFIAPRKDSGLCSSEVDMDNRPNTDIAPLAADDEKEFAGFSFLGQEVAFIAPRKAEPRNAFSAPQFSLDSGLCSSYE